MEQIIIKAHGFYDLFNQIEPLFRAQGTPAGFRRFMDRQPAPDALDMLAIVDDAHQRAQDGAEAACREFGEPDDCPECGSAIDNGKCTNKARHA